MPPGFCKVLGELHSWHVVRALNKCAHGLTQRVDLRLIGVKFVINYDYPKSSEDYVHRIGRTGRVSQIGPPSPPVPLPASFLLAICFAPIRHPSLLSTLLRYICREKCTPGNRFRLPAHDVHCLVRLCGRRTHACVWSLLLIDAVMLITVALFNYWLQLRRRMRKGLRIHCSPRTMQDRLGILSR